MCASTGSGLVMDIFCGKWKSAGCNPKRWFDFVGKSSSGVVAFDLKINLLAIQEENYNRDGNAEMMNFLSVNGMTPFAFKNATRCDQAPPVRRFRGHQ